MSVMVAKNECLRCGQRVGWIGIGANLIMVVLKVIVGLSAGSKACLAEQRSKELGRLTDTIRVERNEASEKAGAPEIQFSRATRVTAKRPFLAIVPNSEEEA